MTELRTITCDHDGVLLEGQLAAPDGPGPHPAVLVMHNAHGLGEQVRETALRLAGLGYLAIATDMYGGGRHFPRPEDAGTVIAPLWADPALLRARLVAWFDRMLALQEADAARRGAIG